MTQVSTSSQVIVKIPGAIFLEVRNANHLSKMVKSVFMVNLVSLVYAMQIFLCALKVRSVSENNKSVDK